MLCILKGGAMILVAAQSFTLSWTHSVEKIEWREDWRVDAAGALRIERAAVKGSGAGMEPGENSRLIDGRWEWRPSLPPQPRLLLAASGATPASWLFCHDSGCLELGGESNAPVVISACSGQAARVPGHAKENERPAAPQPPVRGASD